MAQLEVQDLGVAFTQRLDRAPQQCRGLVVLGDAGRVVERAEAVLDAEAGRPGVARAERGRLVMLNPAYTLLPR